MTDSLEPDKAAPRRLAAVTATQGASQSLLPALVPVIVERCGLGVGTLGLVVALGTAVMMLAAPLWGTVSDRHGRAGVVRAGLLGSLAAQLLFVLTLLALAQGWFSLALAAGLLGASRLLHGASAAGLYPACQAWASDLSAERARLRALATVSAGANLGRALGPALVLLALPLGELAPLGWLLLLPLLGLLALRAVPPAPAAPSAAVVARSRLRGVAGWPLLLALLLTAVAGQVQFLLGPVLVDRFGQSASDAARLTSGCLLAAAVLSVLLQVTAVRRLRRPEFGLAAGLGLLLLATAGLGSAGSVAVTLVAACALAVAAAFVAPAYTALASLQVDASARGRLFAQISVAHTAGYTLGFGVGGQVYHLWPRFPLAGTLVCALLAVAVALGWWRSASARRLVGRDERTDVGWDERSESQRGGADVPAAGIR